MSFEQDPSGSSGFLLRANTDPGGIYQLWRTLDLMPGARRVLEEEVEATARETTFGAPRTPGADLEFFCVKDLME